MKRAGTKLTKQSKKLLVKMRYKIPSFFPFVTTDWEEYRKRTDYRERKPEPRICGQYLYGVIWVKKLTPLTLGHELIHHFLRMIGNADGGTRLFFDFINEIYEEVFGFVCHKTWRNQIRIKYRGKSTNQIWVQVEAIRESWNDWLDWQLCREPKA